ncbi:MAG: retron St85 family effector protein [Saccharospirillum sp.]|uniref:retron St85 family effector protein n=1 Tax=Saccharospirillum sp. TaxID=2033801 RepID=UPI003298BDF0
MLKEITSSQVILDLLGKFRVSISSSKLYLPKDISRFVFLCGANKDINNISERRAALIDFSKNHIPHTHFFLAERMFATLKEEGDRKNLLDVENLISDFSDNIMIVLESPSAFTELGAFSHSALRNKLIVINDAKFKSAPSFVNLGPLKAIADSAGKDKIIHYKMRSDGVEKRDAIGDTYAQIYDIFKEPVATKKRAVKIEEVDPSKKFDKISAMFIHDLLRLAGPLRHNEIIEILKQIFGENERFNNVLHLLAILVSFGSIYRGPDKLYRSQMSSVYFQYKFDVSMFQAAFRNCLLRNYPERLNAA